MWPSLSSSHRIRAHYSKCLGEEAWAIQQGVPWREGALVAVLEGVKRFLLSFAHYDSHKLKWEVGEPREGRCCRHAWPFLPVPRSHGRSCIFAECSGLQWEGMGRENVIVAAAFCTRLSETPRLWPETVKPRGRE